MKRVGDVIVIGPMPDGVCELCGKKAELRPYGPNREKICFECGQKHKSTTESRMAEVLGPVDYKAIVVTGEPSC